MAQRYGPHINMDKTMKQLLLAGRDTSRDVNDHFSPLIDVGGTFLFCHDQIYNLPCLFDQALKKYNHS
jgi:hypothetical protein